MNANGHPLDALGHPTRRHIFELLRSGPRSVGELAAQLPVSGRPSRSTSGVLEEAGLVTHRGSGTRNLYGLNGRGVLELRAWVDGFWDEALVRFAEAAESSGKGGST